MDGHVTNDLPTGVTKRFIVSTWLLVTIHVLCMTAQSRGHVMTYRYDKKTLCDVEFRLSSLCSELSTNSRSMLECTAKCNKRDNCAGVSLDDDGNCFIHGNCPQLTGCSVSTTNHDYREKQRCANGGRFDSVKGTCACVDSWVGSSCRDHPKDCGELNAYGYPEGRHHAWLEPDEDGQALIPVSCFISPDTDFSSVFVLYHRGNTAFNLTWDVYRTGFYHDEQNMWMGLDNWHAVSTIGYNKLYIVLDFGDKGLLYRYYTDFKLQASEEKFWFSHANNWENGRGSVLYAGNKLLDCLGPYQKMWFSSWDRDNDLVPEKNCAAESGFGWWYQGCDVTCNLFGWGDGHQDSRPGHQLLSVPGVDLDTWFSDLNNVYIYIQKL